MQVGTLLDVHQHLIGHGATRKTREACSSRRPEVPPDAHRLRRSTPQERPQHEGSHTDNDAGSWAKTQSLVEMDPSIELSERRREPAEVLDLPSGVTSTSWVCLERSALRDHNECPADDVVDLVAIEDGEDILGREPGRVTSSGDWPRIWRRYGDDVLRRQPSRHCSGGHAER